MWSNSSLASLSGPLRPGVVVPVRVPSIDNLDLFQNYLYLLGVRAKKTLKKKTQKKCNYESTMNTIS